MREKHLKEDLADLAYKAESDHEVQMARAELYKIAKYAIKMHEMLKGVDEQEGLEGWVQSKITKAADYMGSVYHHMDYQVKFDEVQEAKKAKPDFLDMDKDGDKKEPMKKAIKDKKSKQTDEQYVHERGSKKKKKTNEEARDTHCSDKCCGSDVKREDCKCPPDCKHCNCNATNVEEGKGKLKKGHPNYKKQAAAIAISKKANEDKYKGYLSSLLEAKKESTCKECGKQKLTPTEMKELGELDEGKKHGNSKIYDKCWKGCRKVAGKNRGEPGSCKCD